MPLVDFQAVDNLSVSLTPGENMKRRFFWSYSCISILRPRYFIITKAKDTRSFYQLSDGVMLDILKKSYENSLTKPRGNLYWGLSHH